ncbi:MAG TPA: GNAT family N-acetyltransferase [candidate division Zixibacteria bacterium]|nr:GNAT family N-acetyltransferase [candidate division Zixibacteria bacterium]MDD4917279.1 GNAT family N-acetyltransferase [candidate division Zixibacteria bacterium]MDM7973481.1 GNAT family N-acetyltransferase [candidate division Zixibacteria bacterium]HOD65433.1 GNAT family N-acetyltransferase [candidate division Zixibacteria bacterium]HOZ07476.1 GNAT family N-acetyltransferase [candidate division Zixibacteria bacterium]
MLLFTHDKLRLAEHFRRDPVRFAYHLGDLDDALFSRCQWAVSHHKSTRIDECILIYRAPSGPTVLAFGLSERLEQLLAEALDLLPPRFTAHFASSCRPVFARRYDEEPVGRGIRMRLTALRSGPSGDEHSIRRLGAADAADLQRFYREAYPDCRFDETMVATGKYFGWSVDGRLVGAAGVHVYCPDHGVAVIGNVATDPSERNQGIASRLTARLAQELADEQLLVCLNVMVDNLPARRCYEKLGFETAFEYEEARFTFARTA